MNQMMGGEEMGGEMPVESHGGYCIEIRVDASGAISVSSEPLQEEAGEAGESTGKPAKSIGEAIKIAMDIYENSGSADAGEEDFSSGFGAEQPAPMMIREGE